MLALVNVFFHQNAKWVIVHMFHNLFHNCLCKAACIWLFESLMKIHDVNHQLGMKGYWLVHPAFQLEFCHIFCSIINNTWREIICKGEWGRHVRKFSLMTHKIWPNSNDWISTAAIFIQHAYHGFLITGHKNLSQAFIAHTKIWCKKLTKIWKIIKLVTQINSSYNTSFISCYMIQGKSMYF